MRSTTVPADDGTLLHVGVTGAGPDVVVLSGGNIDPAIHKTIVDGAVA